ncbi:hypothetical protein [Pseudomonas sp. Pseusp97]|uniref:hypothetical protein n=1 Tax=Pseudomonas sp. Pseusp97 TaxID=3243065 RepID=UPI0039A688F5
MLIKIPSADDKFVESLKRATGCATGSKAYEKAAAEFDYLTKTVAWQKGEIARLEGVIASRDRVIENARSAAAVLLERVGQGDLLDAVP